MLTQAGIIRMYIVRLRELDTGLVIETQSIVTHITVPVHPAYVYNCSVSAFTVARGPFSTDVSVLTPQAGNKFVDMWYICILTAYATAPSGSPQNIGALPTSSRTLFLSWDPPPRPQRNGEITLYTINVTVLENGETFQVTSDASNLTLSSLRPYYTYSFIITASTIVGEGPFSEALTIRMPEDGMLLSCIPCSLHCFSIQCLQHQ